MEKILIVDDSHLQRRILMDLIKEMGCEYLLAEDGIEGIEKILKENPDCVLLDIVMPNKTGIEVLEELQSMENKIPVIVVTTDSQDATIEQCKQLGAYEVMGKPPQKETLMRSIRKALSQIR